MLLFMIMVRVALPNTANWWRGCVGDRRAVIIDDREAAYQAVIGLFSKTDDAARSFLATEFTDHHRTLAFGTDYDAAVTLFAYKNYVRAVNDHLLIVEALAHKNPVRLRAVFRRFVNGCLNALATADYRIEMRLPDFRLHSEGESSVLVGTLGPEADADLVLRIISVGPLVIEIVKLGRTVAEPGIAVAALAAYVLKTAAGNPVTVTDKTGGNYQFASPVTGTFEIVASSQNPLSITDKPADIRYGDTFNLSATGGSGSGAIHWNIKESNGVAEIDEKNGTVTVTGVGGFTVEAYREAADGYGKSNTDSVRFTAKPKPVTPVVTIKPKNYDGNIHVADDAITVTVRSSDLAGSDSIAINGLTASYDSANAGTNKMVMLDYTNVAVSGTNAGRYVINWPDSVTGTIDRVDAKLAIAPKGADLTYSPGTAQNLITAGTGTTVNNIGTVEYSTSQNGVYSEAVPTGTNAGTYTVWYKVADSVNYTGIDAASIEVEIKKATPTSQHKPHGVWRSGGIAERH